MELEALKSLNRFILAGKSGLGRNIEYFNLICGFIHSIFFRVFYITSY